MKNERLVEFFKGGKREKERDANVMRNRKGSNRYRIEGRHG